MKFSFFLSLLFILVSVWPAHAVSTVVLKDAQCPTGTTNVQQSIQLTKNGWWGRTKAKISNAFSKGKASFNKMMGRDKSQLAAALFALLLGVIGVHRFYLGYPVIGVIYIFTAGIFGIGAIIDLIRIIAGDLKPKHGEYVKKAN